jgi:hypothetical protein
LQRRHWAADSIKAEFSSGDFAFFLFVGAVGVLQNSKTCCRMEVERTNKNKEVYMPRKLGCSCGKLLAKEENGVLYLWCKECRRQIPFAVRVGKDGKPEIVRINEIKAD